MRTEHYRALIDAVADQVGLPPWTYRGQSFTPGEWLEGQILTESGGDPNAMRYEPHHDTPERAAREGDGDQPGRDDGLLEDDRSYGLMQVLGSNIRRLCGVPPGTPMQFSFALLPLANLSLGLRVLHQELRATDNDVARALARFNGGPTGDRLDAAGRMRRAEYVELVARHAARVQNARRVAAAGRVDR